MSSVSAVVPSTPSPAGLYLSIHFTHQTQESRSSCRGKSDYHQDVQAQILAKVEAFERFVTLNALALGLLQVLS
ncbi:hypothetical protein PN467_22670 [Microcystis aeruginosa CS-563/04]|uniref:hypothetical protein n=1 Tax=Microcystis aeruginosa TaxID=1126 RepID=UPI00232D1010|nr:hypothetical protein [Microcystis aeruginosa]MDB9423237.1 hypothetical protein [Microcystis aeruginosa CS-563/04]